MHELISSDLQRQRMKKLNLPLKFLHARKKSPPPDHCTLASLSANCTSTNKFSIGLLDAAESFLFFFKTCIPHKKLQEYFSGCTACRGLNGACTDLGAYFNGPRHSAIPVKWTCAPIYPCLEDTCTQLYQFREYMHLAIPVWRTHAPSYPSLADVH